MARLYIELEPSVIETLLARARGQNRTPGQLAGRYVELAMLAEDHPSIPFGFVSDVVERLPQSKAVIATLPDPNWN